MPADAVVERGISVQASFNTVCAIEYLKSHNVDPEVIERVLLHPEQRRKTCIDMPSGAFGYTQIMLTRIFLKSFLVTIGEI
jgi:hypothetical protein